MPDYSDIRLMVVDDESALRNLLTEILTDDGFKVRAAESGEQALEFFQQEPADIILSDMSMPGMSGIDLLKKVKELRGDHVEFVIITANATLDTAILATKYGAVDYLRKPVEDITEISRLAERLSARVRERREKERVVSGLLDIARAVVGPSADPFLVRSGAVIERLPIPEGGLVLSANAQGAAKVSLSGDMAVKLTRVPSGDVTVTAVDSGDVKPVRIDGIPAKDGVLHGGEHLNIGGADFRFVDPRRVPESEKLLAEARRLFGQDEGAPAKAQTTLRLAGRLDEVALPNLIQMMNLLNKNGVLALKGDAGASGEMYVKDGELIHARLGPVEGRKAVQRMLAWSAGEFSFEQRAVDARRTIEERTDSLLLDSLRQLDELRALGKAVPPRTLRVAVVGRPPDTTSEEKEVLDAVTRYGSVGSILDKCSVPDVDILRALIRFRKEGAITVVAQMGS
ncbi:MAG TPA: response regulator [bacterium]|nr:response regulator [bacterium]